MKEILKRYIIFFVLALLNLALLIIYPAIGQKSLAITYKNGLEMLSILPPIFLLLGLLDVWVERKTMIRLIGEKSGLTGIAVAFFLGSAAAGPLYAAFPVAGVLLNKGGKFSNVLILIGAWSTVKIPVLLYEASAMGWAFTLTRFLTNLPGIALIAYVTERLLSEGEKQEIYRRAAMLK